MRLSNFSALAFITAAMVNHADADSAVDPNATVVELRSSCIAQGATYLDNCFESTSDLTDWLWGNNPVAGTRASLPSSLDPVHVQVGPGTFDPVQCFGAMNGWVNFTGSGRELSRFLESDPGASGNPALNGHCPGAIDVADCTGLSFQDLTAEGLTRGVNWQGDGSSLWRDVDIVADAHGAPACKQLGSFYLFFAWYDLTPGSTGQVFFWNTRFVNRQPPPDAFIWINSPFGTTGIDAWAYSSDVLLDLDGAAKAGAIDAAVYFGAGGGGRLRIFGSTIRFKQAGSVLPLGNSAATGVLVQGGTEFHMHGGIINVNIEAPDRDVVAIDANQTAYGLVHTPETAFSVRESTGSATSWRLRSTGNATLRSPFQWPAATAPPNLGSLHGQDTFVKTDAGPNGNETRLYIFDSSCGSQWRDVGSSGCL